MTYPFLCATNRLHLCSSLLLFTCRPGNESNVESTLQALFANDAMGIESAFNTINWSEEVVDEFIQGFENNGVYQGCFANIPVRNCSYSLCSIIVLCLLLPLPVYVLVHA